MKIDKNRKSYMPILVLLLIIALSNTNIATGFAATSEAKDKIYNVTLKFDPKYYNGKVNNIGIMGEFLFYKSNLNEHTDKAGMVDNKIKYVPSQYTNDMSSIGGFYYEEMKYDQSEKVYKATLNLPAGVYDYHFVVNGTLSDPDNGAMSWSNVYTPDGKLHGLKFTFDNWITDPKNKPTVHTVTGTQNNSELIVGTEDDYPWIPNRNKSKRGDVTFDTYMDVNNTVQSLGIYLPADYDKNASKPYKVIYVSHGGGGNENDWYSQGGINNIMDNLIAQGKTKDAIVVTMNNAIYSNAERSWDFPKIADNMFKCIIPYMQKNYNISKEVNDRAFCGLSMGSLTTCYMYQHYASRFGYFGAFSGGLAGGKYFNLSSPDLKNAVFMIGSGEEDMAYNTTEIGVPSFEKELDEKGIKYIPYFVTGSHDWYAWPQLFTNFAENVLWSKDKK